MNFFDVICPKCKKPTKRQPGMGTTTLINVEPGYVDEKGMWYEPHDPNFTTTAWTCLECNTTWSVTTDAYGKVKK